MSDNFDQRSYNNITNRNRNWRPRFNNNNRGGYNNRGGFNNRGGYFNRGRFSFRHPSQGYYNNNQQSSSRGHQHSSPININDRNVRPRLNNSTTNTPPASNTDQDGKLKVDLILGDVTYYLKDEEGIKKFTRQNIKAPKRLKIIKHSTKNFVKAGLDMDKHVIRSLIVCLRETWFTSGLSTQYDELVDELAVGKTDSSKSHILYTLEAIQGLYRAQTYFIVNTGGTSFKSMVSYCATRLNMVVMYLSPVNLASFESFSEDQKADIFIRRTIHPLRYHHLELEQRLNNVSDDHAIEL